MNLRHIAPNEAIAARRRVHFKLNDILGGPRTDKAGEQPEISIDFATYVGSGSIGVLVQVAGGAGNDYYAELAVASLATPGSIIHSRFGDGDTVETEGETIFVSSFQLAQLAMIRGTVIATVTPTTTVFELSDVTDAAVNFHRDASVIFTHDTTTAALRRKQTVVTAYELLVGRGHFTVSPALSVAPAAGDTLILV